MNDVNLCLRLHSLQDLEKKFEKYGPVREARIVRNPRSGESRGFGFLIMENDDDVDRVSCHHALHVPFTEEAAIHLLIIMARMLNIALIVQAIRHLDGRDWNGRRLLVERAKNVK